MKNKLLYMFVTLLVLLFVGLASSNLDHTDYRVHQHRNAAPEQICKHDSRILCSHLPLVSIDTGGEPIEGEQRDGSETNAVISVFDSPLANNHLSDTPAVESTASIRYRGTSSMEFDKKGYKIKFINEDSSDRNVSLMGMDEHHDWVLHGPFLDKTLIRNYMWYNIAGEIMDYAPNVRFCELIVDGKYQGLYLAVETISRGSTGRLNLTKYKQGDHFTSYIIRLDRGSRSEISNINNFTKYARRTILTINIEYPGTSKLTPELNAYIKNDFSRFEKALYSYDYDNKNLGYKSYIDIESFVDYFIINEFTQNYDAGSLSTYLYKDLKGKLNMIVWDLNSACDNYIETTVNDLTFEFQNNLWFYMLVKDESFTEAIIQRYFNLRETYLNEEYLLNYIDETIEYLGDAIDHNFNVWDYTFLPSEGLLLPKERNLKSYEEAVDQLKSFIIKRGRWMDKNIYILRQFSHESKVKKFNH